MINVSSEFKKQLTSDNRKYLEYADITLNDGTVLNLTNEHLWNGGITIENAVSSDSSFDIGSAIVGTCSVVINNIYDDYSDYDFTLARVVAYIGLQLPDGTIEKLRKGTFFVDEAKYNGEIITLSCMDSMYKFDEAYSQSNLSYPATLGAIVRDACSCCGVTLSPLSASFDNDDFVVDSRPDDESLTFRQLLSWVGQLSCHYCTCDVYGRLYLGWYNVAALEDADDIDGGNMASYSTGDSVDGGNFMDYSTGDNVDGGSFNWEKDYHQIKSLKTMSVFVDDVVITGVRVTEEVQGETETEYVSYQSGEDGYVLGIENNKFVQGKGEELATYLGAKLNGLRFRPLSVTCLSDPTVEAGDIGIVTDRKGNKYKTIITSTKFQFGNYQSVSCGAETPARKSATRFSEATKAYRELRKNLDKNKTEWEKAMENLSNRLAESGGLFSTIETQEDSSKIFYLHNKPELNESDIVWKMTAEAWGVSTDGGKTWNGGMTVDGEVIARILNTIGINADWINTGALVVKNAQGETLFNADVDTGRVDIVADSFSLKGKTIAEIAQEQVGEITIPNYYGSYTPTLSNQPAVSWAVEDYSKHDGSIFMDFLNNKIYVFKASGTSGTWEELENEAVVDFDTVFNALTNNGEWDGIFMENGHLYINTSYLHGDKISADLINLKNVSVKDSSGNTTFAIDQYGNVSIRANSFSLSGSTIQSIANSAASSYASSALSSAKSYTDQQLADFNPDVSLTQKEIFNILTNNGQTQGIMLVNGKIYVNAEYIDSTYFAGWNVYNAYLYGKSGFNEVYLDAKNGCVKTKGDTEIYGGYGYAMLQGNNVYADIGKFYSLEIQGDSELSGSVNVGGTLRGYYISVGTQSVSSGTYFSTSGAGIGTNLTFSNRGTNILYAPRVNISYIDSGTGTTLVRTNSGYLAVTSSSKRYKNHVRNLDEAEVECLYDLPIIWFRYKEGHISKDDALYMKEIPGIYAEDLSERFPDAAIFNSEGQPEDWDPRRLIPAMLKLIQSQNDRIKELERKDAEKEARIARLEQLIGGVE